jgi:hypothetical protein
MHAYSSGDSLEAVVRSTRPLGVVLLLRDRIGLGDALGMASVVWNV